MIVLICGRAECKESITLSTVLNEDNVQEVLDRGWYIPLKRRESSFEPPVLCPRDYEMAQRIAPLS